MLVLNKKKKENNNPPGRSVARRST